MRESRAVKDRSRKGGHLAQRSRLFSIKDGISTPSLSPRCDIKFAIVLMFL